MQRVFRYCLGALLLPFFCFSQNKQLIYDFDAIPQSLLVNPATSINSKLHIGFPLLSGIYASAGSSGISIYDVFVDNDESFDTKINRAINKLKANDALRVNEQLEIISFGFKGNQWHPDDYYSFGIYQELDVFSYWPEDPAILLYEGNVNHIGRQFNLSDISTSGELFTVYHAGITRVLNRKLTAGLRVKLYNSIAEVSSVGNSGSFFTGPGTNNIYTHTLSADIDIRSSGITALEDAEKTKDVVKRAIFSGNFGLGMDFGFSFKKSKQETITGSILDVGGVWYTNSIKRYSFNGVYSFDGIELLFPEIATTTTFDDYWNELKDELEANFEFKETSRSYFKLRPLKINVSYKYAFENKRNEDCDCLIPEGYTNYQNEIGLQFFSVVRPKGPELALTAFYRRKLFNAIDFKTTYTIDKYSFTNIGAGLSLRLGPINMHFLVDNLLEFQNLAKANTLSAQFGLNYIIRKQLKK